VKKIRAFFRGARTAYGRVFIRSSAYLMFLMISFSLIMAFINYSYEIRAVENALKRAAIGHAKLIAGLSADKIGRNDFATLQPILNALASEPEVVAAKVFSASGQLIAFDKGVRETGVTPASDPLALETVSTGEPVTGTSAHFTDYYLPVFRNGEVIGAVLVKMSHGELQAVRSEVFFQVLVLFGILIVAIVPLGTYLMYRSTRGISRVTQAANEAAQGFLDPDMVVDAAGEVGELQEAFKAMAVNLRKTIKHIEYLAHVDGVTGLPNRLKFENTAIQLIDLSPRAEGAVLFIDLDRFKTINDMHGHAVGDELLKHVAARISSLVAEYFEPHTTSAPFVARFAGDEFVAVLPGMTDAEKLVELSGIAIEKIGRPVRVDPLSLIVRASMGIALYPQDGAVADDVLRCADMAMYRSKEEGRDQATIFNEKIREEALERQKIESHLMHALDNDELRVFYQPKIDLTSGKIIGSEALLRWSNPELGNVPPFKFVPIAEECGLMTPIGEFVLRQSLEDMNCLLGEGHNLKIAVNVAPVQFQSIYFTDRTLGILGESGFPLDRLELEITESSVMDDPQSVMSQILPIKEEGVQLAIDDFGTGYSSLNTLATMPFDTIKIDRSFVRDMAEDENQRAIVQLILMMARQLKMKTVAEGIETPLQFDQLRAWGASYAQGYLWSPPVEYGAFATMVRNGLDTSPATTATSH
jgi:diguanylate cyclase (GGDEF)-like protein